MKQYPIHGYPRPLRDPNKIWFATQSLFIMWEEDIELQIYTRFSKTKLCRFISIYMATYVLIKDQESRIALGRGQGQILSVLGCGK